MAPYATYGAGTKQAAIENMEQINGSLTALSGPKQAADFWTPAAWPDLLCAYKPNTRQLAVVHVVIAMGLAFVCWQPTILTSYMNFAVGLWQAPQFLELKALGLCALFALLTIQTLLPLMYLVVIRYQNLNASSSKEISALQMDIQTMLQAVGALQHVSEAPNSTSNASHTSACSASHDKSQGPLIHQDGQSSTETQSPGKLDEPSSTETIMGRTAEDQAPDQGPSQLRRRQFEVMPAPLKTCTMAAEDDLGADCKASEDSIAFQAQLAAALEGSSRTISNLVSRLETMVYYRSGVHIQGHAACTAALEILAGEEKLPATLTEALAAIKIIGSSWPARNPPTPFSQFWRPSAWADHFRAYTPWDRMLLACNPLPGHVLIEPFRFCFLGGLYVSYAIDQGAPLRQRLMGVFGFLVVMGNITAMNAIAAWRRNLKVRDRHVSSNMPALFAHLRQLTAAGRVIQDHITQSSSQPVSELCKASCGLALVHAMHDHGQITNSLMMRLEAAYFTCTKLDKQVLLRHLENKTLIEKVDTIEDMMELYPYTIRSSR